MALSSFLNNMLKDSGVDQDFIQGVDQAEQGMPGYDIDLDQEQSPDFANFSMNSDIIDQAQSQAPDQGQPQQDDYYAMAMSHDPNVADYGRKMMFAQQKPNITQDQLPNGMIVNVHKDPSGAVVGLTDINGNPVDPQEFVKKQKGTSNMQEYLFAVEHDGYKGTFQQWEDRNIRRGRSLGGGGSSGYTGVPGTGSFKMDTASNALVKDMQKNAQAFDNYGQATDQVMTALDSGNQYDYIGAIFGYMKMLDPTSTVREGEYATVGNAGGIPDFVRSAWNQMIDGTFSEKASRDLASSLNKTYKTHESAYNKTLKRNQQYFDKLQVDQRYKPIPAEPINTDKQYSRLLNKQAPQGAIDALAQNPGLADQFKEHYGYLPKGY